MPEPIDQTTLAELALSIKRQAQTLGFAEAKITVPDTSSYHQDMIEWLQKDYQGDMTYMIKQLDLRLHPDKLFPGVKRIIMVRMNYLPGKTHPVHTLKDTTLGYISRYALGGDYHTFIRKRLQQLADFIQEKIGVFGYRAFADSAPILEKPLAQEAGLGWIGKNTLLLHKQDGSWFFLGELFTDLSLPVDIKDNQPGCGACTACIQICPTQAIVAPYQLDARRCISYLTIELRGSIPVELRPLMGNRIYGCDDCQLICPWNRYAKASQEQQFAARHALEGIPLTVLFSWDEATFLEKTKGSAIRRIGYVCWLRNIAVALGNAPSSEGVIQALRAREQDASELVREHVAWALTQHQQGHQAIYTSTKLTTKMNNHY